MSSVRARTYDPAIHDREVKAVVAMREAEELLMIEEADAWFEYLEATRSQIGDPLRRDRALGLGPPVAAAARDQGPPGAAAARGGVEVSANRFVAASPRAFVPA